MNFPSIIITGPPYTEKEKILKSTAESLNTSFNSVLSISTDHSSSIDKADVLSIAGGETISPEDLTGIGIETSDWLEKQTAPTLVTLENLNTLCMYHDNETIFRFLHVLQSRLKTTKTTFIAIEENAENLSNPRPHLELFDYVIYTRLNDDNNVEYTIQKNSADLPTLEINH